MSNRTRPAAKTVEERENQLVNLAIDLAEKQLANGTARSQVITHYLKIGSTKERIEKEILSEQRDFIREKTEAMRSAKRVEELYKNALDAMRSYSGNRANED